MAVQPAKPTRQQKLIPVTEWPLFYTWPPIGGLRDLIFKNKDGFRDKVVVRCGRRVLIDVEKFHQWLDETNGRGNV
jgi:hypothetical protein